MGSNLIGQQGKACPFLPVVPVDGGVRGVTVGMMPCQAAICTLAPDGKCLLVAALQKYLGLPAVDISKVR